MLHGIKKSTKTILITALVLNIVAGAGYMLLYGQVQNVFARMDTLSSRVTQLLMLQDKEKNERHIVLDTQQSRDKLNTYFITEEDTVSFIERIETLAQTAQTNLNIDAVNIKEEGLEVMVTTSGSWDSVFHFISLIEAMPFRISVKNTTLRYTQESGWTGSLSVLVTSFVKE